MPASEQGPSSPRTLLGDAVVGIEALGNASSRHGLVDRQRLTTRKQHARPGFGVGLEVHLADFIARKRAVSKTNPILGGEKGTRTPGT